MEIIRNNSNNLNNFKNNNNNNNNENNNENNKEMNIQISNTRSISSGITNSNLLNQEKKNDLIPVRSNLRTFMRMITGASVSANITVPKHQTKRMLTSGQLSDLFRRLDRDGNGELDLEEFTQIISKLKINASEEFITRIFQKVDIAQTGTLSLQEFVSAYQMIYTRPSVIGDSESREYAIKRRASEFICAVRYGSDSLGKNIFEMILGHVVDMSDGPHLKLNEKRVYKIHNYNGEFNDLPYDIIPGFNKTLPDLNEMITKDSISNQSIKSKIFWWIDISMAKVSAARVDKYVAAFGLPNDSKFRSAFSQYGTLLRKDEKSHVYAANGNSNLGGVSSLNFFVQALWISRLPVVHHIPAWLDNTIENYCTPSLKASFKSYYYSRFAFFFNSSALNSNLHQDEIAAVENAQLISNRLHGNEGFQDMEEEELLWKKNPTNILLPANVIHRNKSKYQAEPSWLLSNSDLKKRPPKVRCEDLSIHILHQGHDPSAVITIREIDDESSCYSSPNISKVGSTIAEDSKKGILGRILTGIRSKIVKNLCSDGIVPIAGELTDSPAALASIIITLTQSYSMNTLGSLVTWLNLLSNEIGDLAVSKHSNHSKELSSLIVHLLDYALPTYEFMNNLYIEGAQVLAEEAQIEAENLAAAAGTSAGGVGGSINESDEDSYFNDNSHGRDKLQSHDSLDDEESEDQLKSRLRTRTISLGSRLSHLIRGSKDGSYHARGISQAQLSVAILPSACQNVPISFIYARPFLSDNPIRYLSLLVDGDESLEVKGIKYWTEQLINLSATATKLKEDIKISLEDKRNFFNFILTMVTVYLAPLTILCGYWGMNFGNMSELHPENNPQIPGVQIMWVTALVVYSFFLVMSVHFRILYSAT